MHVLESMMTDEPPIRALTFEERYKRLWIESGCLKENVIFVLDKIEKPTWDAQVSQSKKLIEESERSITLIIDPSLQEHYYCQKYAEVR